MHEVNLLQKEGRRVKGRYHRRNQWKPEEYFKRRENGAEFLKPPERHRHTDVKYVRR